MQARVLFESVWKKFRRGERHDSLRDLVPALVRRGLRGRSPDQLADQEFWAVHDVSFETHAGQALGIIGPNGAGKSTVLKLLTKILRPTRGRAEVRGRVGALIEVAAGFHPDLTGRENVYLQGAIMHMKRAEIARKFDEIVEFAGLAPFIDTPVKRYSSGMNARLGFSIAAHLEPQVLLIDEVLSVGDMGFQQRCVERMHQFKRQGVAIVFVSHNLQAVADLCERTVYLQSTARAVGPTLEVIARYVAASDGPGAPAAKGSVEIVSAELIDSRGQPATAVNPGDALTLRVTYHSHAPAGDLLFGFLAYRSTDRLLVYDANFGSRELAVPRFAGDERLVVDFHFRAHLTRGQYHLACHVFDTTTQEYTSRACPVAIFTVRENRTFAGIADLQVAGAINGGRLRGDPAARFADGRNQQPC
jgi:homopolymeric O-antigen transport system ATP-binding protein